MADNAVRSEHYRIGMNVRRSVLGDTHVDRASNGATDFDAPFQELITEAAWGLSGHGPAGPCASVPSSRLRFLQHWDKTRKLPCIYAPRKYRRDKGGHLRSIDACRYLCGVPASNHAFKIAKQTYAQMETEEAEK